jgi:hypothetical protein
LVEKTVLEICQDSGVEQEWSKDKDTGRISPAEASSGVLKRLGN